ncbi:MAG: hypothetical protein A2W47_03270 [Gammaproteobacteria bacterium RIFCSPHIGHO2_12_38_15]|nr:MAG: hypothetical protein A2W47_03270 [Gammaproteobacteria bacterium RIFCSPHIGHO2_12_38_15]
MTKCVLRICVLRVYEDVERRVVNDQRYELERDESETLEQLQAKIKQLTGLHEIEQKYIFKDPNFYFSGKQEHGAPHELKFFWMPSLPGDKEIYNGMYNNSFIFITGAPQGFFYINGIGTVTKVPIKNMQGLQALLKQKYPVKMETPPPTSSQSSEPEPMVWRFEMFSNPNDSRNTSLHPKITPKIDYYNKLTDSEINELMTANGDEALLPEIVVYKLAPECTDINKRLFCEWRDGRSEKSQRLNLGNYADLNALKAYMEEESYQRAWWGMGAPAPVYPAIEQEMTMTYTDKNDVCQALELTTEANFSFAKQAVADAIKRDPLSPRPVIKDHFASIRNGTEMAEYLVSKKPQGFTLFKLEKIFFWVREHENNQQLLLGVQKDTEMLHFIKLLQVFNKFGRAFKLTSDSDKEWEGHKSRHEDTTGYYAEKKYNLFTLLRRKAKKFNEAIFLFYTKPQEERTKNFPQFKQTCFQLLDDMKESANLCRDKHLSQTKRAIINDVLLFIIPGLTTLIFGLIYYYRNEDRDLCKLLKGQHSIFGTATTQKLRATREATEDLLADFNYKPKT